MGSRLGSEVDGSTVAHGQHSLGGAVSSQGKRTTGARGWDKPQALQVGAGGGQRAPQRNRESNKAGRGGSQNTGHLQLPRELHKDLHEPRISQ